MPRITGRCCKDCDRVQPVGPHWPSGELATTVDHNHRCTDPGEGIEGTALSALYANVSKDPDGASQEHVQRGNALTSHFNLDRALRAGDLRILRRTRRVEILPTKVIGEWVVRVVSGGTRTYDPPPLSRAISTPFPHALREATMAARIFFRSVGAGRQIP